MSDPAIGDRHTVPDTAANDVLNGNQCSSGLSSQVTEEAAIDGVVLGMPFGDDSGTVNDTPHFPAVGHIITPRPVQPLHPQIKAGCVWDADNWSCAYDAVFISLWSIYRNSSSGWRNKWRQQAPEWGNFLGAAFDSLLAMAQDTRTSQVELSRRFTSFRETFRDKLSRINPAYFRRHGAVLASVCRILGHIFGNSAGCEPYLNQVVACDHCDISTYERCSFSLLGSTELLDGYLGGDDVGPFLPLQTAVTRYIQHISREPQCDHCRTCSGPLRVESLSIPEMAWLWIELCDPISPIAPSPRLVFGSQDQRQAYTLQAVIYHGGNHFTARFSDQSATWWKYDGKWRFGAPCVDHVEDEMTLLENDNRRAAFLLYSRADFQD